MLKNFQNYFIRTKKYTKNKVQIDHPVNSPQVRLDWTLPNQGRRGVLCLPNLPLTDSMVATLTSSSVSTKIEINGDAWHGTDLSFDCGRPLTVRMGSTPLILLPYF